MKSYEYLAFVAVIVMLSTLINLEPLALAADPVHEPGVLENLKEFAVRVEQLEPDIERDGLAAGTIRTDALLRLRQLGINVLPLKENLKTEEAPCLYVNIRVMKLKPKGYVYGVMVELHEKLLNPRVSSALWVITYRTRGGGGFAYHLATIRDAAKNQVEEFITAYLSQNPT